MEPAGNTPQTDAACREDPGVRSCRGATAFRPCRKGDIGMLKRLKAFIRDEEGATATEYAVMLALIIVIALGAISALGTKVSTTFADIEANMP